MIRILLVLVVVAAINATAWGIGFYDDATSMGGRANWSPIARRAVSMGGTVGRVIYKPFFWIGGNSPSLFAVAGVILLEASILEVVLRLYGVGEGEEVS